MIKKKNKTSTLNFGTNGKFTSAYKAEKEARENDISKKTTSLSEDRKENIKNWVTFYRRNIHRFAEHYLGIKLHLYQILILYLMNTCPLVVVVASRATAKSFITALYAVSKAILYPNSSIVVVSSTLKQSKIIISEKIQKELLNFSPTLDREISNIVLSAQEMKVTFHNGSTIFAVTASDNARGARATLIIYEEFRLLNKKILDAVISPFLITRQSPFLMKPEYSHLREEPVEIYISSAYLRSHWIWKHIKLATVSMYKKSEAVVFATDYSVTLRHGIRTFRQLKLEKKKLDSMTFAMEYENKMLGTSEKAYFDYDLISPTQTIKKAFYPRRHIDVIDKKKNPYTIKKNEGEIRVLACDINTVEGDANDNSAFTCIRAIPVKNGYERHVVYIEAHNGGHTTKQCIRIKQLFNDFEADYLVIDAQQAGISFIDELMKIQYDEQRDMEHEPWTYLNDEVKEASRFIMPNAKKVVFPIKASAGLNHDIAKTMRDTFLKHQIKLLIGSNEGREFLEDTIKEYYSSTVVETKVEFEKPYLDTDMLINEMVNLSYEIMENSKLIRLKEPKGGRKDRYTSLSYGNYFIHLMEKDLYEDGDDNYDFAFFLN